jgi:outer membrane receptor for ferrienterochelin and colicins
MTIRRQLLKLRTNNPENLVARNFIQDEITFTEKQKLLLGMRYDYNSIHGSIITPNCLQMEMNDNNIIRLNAGTGFRV